ncbi:retrovirus-related Pol polyprotein LINE-1 [Elysia marginata]|uniref:Retrovirus-related Pol polyprotein LINE-1 n=1 Tax=Elysia marginata TaxID=1093978 RepID=A0AAV4JMH9_9GAST|nr:retrovirus-related Pol polyprotein LINE-1 [Elysia marginata]
MFLGHFNFLYVCESWTLNADTERKIRALEMRCYRRPLGISYKEHITNEELRRRIENAIGPHVNLWTIVRKWKMRWYGHISRLPDLAKNTMHGTVNGGRKNAGMTTSKNGEDLSRRTPYRKLKIERNRKLWLGDPLLCPNGSQI